MMIVKKNLNNYKKSLRQIVIDWNNRWPIDYWWRKRYNISFGIPEHRDMNFIDMLFEYQEEKLFSETIKSRVNNQEEEEFAEITGDLIKSRSPEIKMSEDEIDYDFEHLDPNKFNT